MRERLIMLAENTKNENCSIKVVYRRLRYRLRAAFERPRREDAKNDVATASLPLTLVTVEPEGVPLTRTLKCPRCSHILRIGPSASNPLDPELPSNSSAPLAQHKDCTRSKPLEEPGQFFPFLPFLSGSPLRTQLENQQRLEPQRLRIHREIRMRRRDSRRVTRGET